MGERLFFSAFDGIEIELWTSDGSTDGTVRVADIKPGGFPGSMPDSLTAVGGSLFFSADDGSGGRELWKSDGTAAGTVRVADIRAGSDGSFPSDLTAVGETLFFTAADSDGNRELWRSDGSTDGTIRVADIRPGSDGAYPSSLTRVGDTLFFLVSESSSGQELWKSDGTAAGTKRVADIFSGETGSYPLELTAAGDTLFFSAQDGSSGRELWKTDGTAAGTVRVADIYPGSLSTSFGSSYPMGSYPQSLTAVGDTLFFSAQDSSSGREPWKTDGTAAGTVRVADIRPGSFGSEPSDLAAVGETLFFTADDGSSGRELWKTDGTAAGTVRVIDIRPGSASADPIELIGIGSMLYFSANNKHGQGELWQSDGTPEGTRPIRNNNPFQFSTDPRNFTVAGNSLFYSAFSNGEELWALDLERTQPLSSFSLSSLPASIAEGNSDSSPITFRITRTGDLSQTSTVHWSVAGSGANPATAEDFLNAAFPSGVLNFASGQSALDVRVRIAGDISLEPDEGFTVTLSDPNGASIDPAFSNGFGTIRNDDAPPLSKLAIAATDADKEEGLKGSTRFTFTVSRSGDTTGASSARWAVAGHGSNPAGANSFARGVLPSGTVRFRAGDTARTISVTVQGDCNQERDEGFQVTLSAPSGATISTVRATGLIRNDDLIGTSGADKITGSSRAEFLDGFAGQDILAGRDGSDMFGFRFGQSRITTPDRISDFRFGQDQIVLFNRQGQPLPSPAALSRAADNSSAVTLAGLTDAVFADADGGTAGNQPLAPNAAALIRATNAAIAGTYLLINDRTAGGSFTADLLVEITGHAGTFPAPGIQPVELMFA